MTDIEDFLSQPLAKMCKTNNSDAVIKEIKAICEKDIQPDVKVHEISRLLEQKRACGSVFGRRCTVGIFLLGGAVLGSAALLVGVVLNANSLNAAQATVLSITGLCVTVLIATLIVTSHVQRDDE